MTYLVMREGATPEEMDESLDAPARAIRLVTGDYSQAMEHAQSAATRNKHPYVIAKVVEVARYRPRVGG